MTHRLFKSYRSRMSDIYINIYLCGITFVHKRVLNYHIYRWKEQNNYVGEK